MRIVQQMIGVRHVNLFHTCLEVIFTVEARLTSYQIFANWLHNRCFLQVDPRNIFVDVSYLNEGEKSFWQ